MSSGNPEPSLEDVEVWKGVLRAGWAHEGLGTSPCEELAVVWLLSGYCLAVVWLLSGCCLAVVCGAWLLFAEPACERKCQAPSARNVPPPLPHARTHTFR